MTTVRRTFPSIRKVVSLSAWEHGDTVRLHILIVEPGVWSAHLRVLETTTIGVNRLRPLGRYARRDLPSGELGKKSTRSIGIVELENGSAFGSEYKRVSTHKVHVY